MVMGNDGVRNSFIWLTDSVNGFRFRPESSASANNDYTAPKDANYHHYVMVADGSGKLSLYVDNGTAEVKNSATGGTSFTIDAIGSAYDSLSLSYGGQLDEIYIFDEAIDAVKVAELYAGGQDTVDPTVVSISSNRGSGPVEPNSLVTYTVTFSESMDTSTVTPADFSNMGTASISIGAVTATSLNSFVIPVTPNSAGSLRLQINQNASLSDVVGNPLDTSSAIPDDITISIEVDNSPPTLLGSDMVSESEGDPVAEGTTLVYTVTFSEDIDENTVDASDFGNAGDATFTIGTITEISLGVFSVEITPTSGGTIQLKIINGAVINDFAGNPLDTSNAIVASETITVFEAPTPADVRLLRVVFVGGQSNADGRAATSGLPTSPVDLQQPQDDVDFFYRVENTIFPLTTLRPGLSETGAFGPAITCGRRLADELSDGITTRIAIIKYANGGTNLHTQWKAGGDATTSNDGNNYIRFQQTVTAGLVALSSTYPNAAIELVGMVWVQGESDAGDATNSAAYAANLTNFIADIRLTYGADLRFVVVRLSNGQTAINATNLATLRSAQSSVASADPLTDLVDSDGFGMSGDNLHFDATGQQQIGDSAAGWLLNSYPFLKPLEIATQANGDFEVHVDQAFDSFLYTLQSNPSLQPGDWQDLETITASSPTVTFTHTPEPGATKEFFRVIRSKAP